MKILKKIILVLLLIIFNSNLAYTVYAAQTETEHFKIFYPEDYEDIMSTIKPKIEDNYKSIISHLNDVDFNKNISIKIYSNLKDFHEAIGWPDAPDWVSGRFQDGLLEIVVENQDSNRAITLITHEMTHLVTCDLNSGFIPIVIFEGIATYEADQHYLKDQLQVLDEFPTIEELFSLNYNNKFLYPLSYSFVEFIVQNYGYEKIIDLLKVNYQNNEFEFDSIKDIYSGWIKSLEKN